MTLRLKGKQGVSMCALRLQHTTKQISHASLAMENTPFFLFAKSAKHTGHDALFFSKSKMLILMISWFGSMKVLVYGEVPLRRL